MNYEEAISYIEKVSCSGIMPGLVRIQALLEKTGHPEMDCNVIHVAGTNGKGSVCTYIASILMQAGYKVGRYVSPTLFDYRERIQVNGKWISRKDTAYWMSRVREVDERMQSEGIEGASAFELETVMAFLYFKAMACDFVVLETGMGGRLDATTAVENPVACVITSISLDHMQFLGNTVREIAGEKAGIIVPGVPVIYDGNDKDAAEVIAAKAKELGSPAYKVIQAGAKVLGNNKDGIDFSLEDDYYGDTRFHIPFIAWYQVMNASLALTTMEVLKDRIPVTMEQLQAGIANTRWQGRMETILPGVIVDGAHNEDGVRRFVETAERFQKEYPLTLLFSAVNDKDYQDMIHTICSRIKFRKVVTTEVGGYREVPSAELAEIFCKEGCKDVGNSDNIEEAFHMAHEAKGEDGMLFCVGSLYLVGEIKTLLLKK